MIRDAEIKKEAEYQTFKKAKKHNLLKRQEEHVKSVKPKHPLGPLFPQVEDVREHIKHLDTEGRFAVRTELNADHYRIAENVEQFGSLFKSRLSVAVASKKFRIDCTHPYSGKKYQALHLSKIIDELEEEFYKERAIYNDKIKQNAIRFGSLK